MIEVAQRKQFFCGALLGSALLMPLRFGQRTEHRRFAD